MAGVKGRSGGARPGAGRPKKAKPDQSAQMAAAFVESMKVAAADVQAEHGTPLAFLLAVMRGDVIPAPEQLKAAIAAAPFVHLKQGEGGKKDQRADKAKQASQGKFASAAPPRLVVSNK